VTGTTGPGEMALVRWEQAPAMLADSAISLARAAAAVEAGDDGLIGEYLGAVAEDEVAMTAAFDALNRGYRGWHWSVTLAVVDARDPTISEVVLLPGTAAVLAPPWVPWEQRIGAGDLGAGDLLPTSADDLRLVPGYLESDDPAIEDLAHEVGIGRSRVLSREGRDEAAQRWHDGPFGPDATIAQRAPGECVTCGFYVQLGGLLGTALGACANEYSPADGHVVDAGYGCGAHSEARIDAPLISAYGPSAIDELALDVHPRPITAGRQTHSDRDAPDSPTPEPVGHAGAGAAQAELFAVDEPAPPPPPAEDDEPALWEATAAVEVARAETARVEVADDEVADHEVTDEVADEVADEVTDGDGPAAVDGPAPDPVDDSAVVEPAAEPRHAPVVGQLVESAEAASDQPHFEF